MTYISNGTMGDMWMAKNCFRCQKDHGYHDAPDSDEGEPCITLMGLLGGEHPLEGLVVHKDRPWPDELECTYFAECGCE